jgi:hypothetical protein
MQPSDDFEHCSGNLFLHPFRARNPLTGKWYKVQSLAERHEIVARVAEWEIIGPPEIRRLGADAFSPWR